MRASDDRRVSFAAEASAHQAAEKNRCLLASVRHGPTWSRVTFIGRGTIIVAGHVPVIPFACSVGARSASRSASRCRCATGAMNRDPRAKVATPRRTYARELLNLQLGSVRATNASWKRSARTRDTVAPVT